MLKKTVPMLMMVAMVFSITGCAVNSPNADNDSNANSSASFAIVG